MISLMMGDVFWRRVSSVWGRPQEGDVVNAASMPTCPAGAATGLLIMSKTRECV